jgi:hypothetical protein
MQIDEMSTLQTEVDYVYHVELVHTGQLISGSFD